MAHQVLVSPLGQTTDTVVFSAWYKQVGDRVKEGETLFAIETDKATLDIEAQASGILVQANAVPGESVAALSEIGVIALAGEIYDRSKASHPVHDGRLTQNHRQAVESILQREFPAGQFQVQKQVRIFISPRARRLAEANGMQWGQIIGTGPEGAIVERDVRADIDQTAGERQPAEVKSTPPVAQSAPFGFYQSLSAETDTSALVAVLARINRRDAPVSQESLMLYVLAQALREKPLQNSPSHTGGIAVVLETPLGLKAPVIRDAAQYRLVELSRRIDDFKMRAGQGNFDSAEMAGAEIAFLDLGANRVDTFSGYVYVPGVPTLGIGRIRQSPMDRHSLWINLTYEHESTVDLAALRLMEALVKLIEEPDLLL